MGKYLNIYDFIQPEFPTTFIIGARGVGKTISAFTQEIKRCYASDSKFIYLRRYQSEIDTLGINIKLISNLTGLDVNIETVKDNNGRHSKMITAGIGHDEEKDFIDKETGETLTKKVRVVENKKNLGYLLALSVASKYKSNDYSNVELIVYDEFIDIRGRELKNEVNLFLNFSMTVFRDFTKYKALFLANATDLFNCYFVGFNMLPKGKITKNKKLGIKIVMYETSSELSERNYSPLAKLMNFVSDDDSSLSNRFSSQDGFISRLGKKAECAYIFNFNNEDYGMWKENDLYVISNKLDPQCPNKIIFDEVSEKYVYNPSYLITIARMLINYNLAFSNEMVRGKWFKLLKEKRLI